MTPENLTKSAEFDTEISNNMSDNEYLMVQSSRFAYYINTIQGPDDLVMLQTQKVNPKGWHGRRITDLDGDGVEDNESLTHDQLDEFYDPLVFGIAEDINNTRHGNLPGHVQAWRVPTEPSWHKQDLVQESWKTK